MSEPILIDALIVGGGAAGLFALHALRRAGVSALLVENHSLGFGQTTSSQGILHAGVKYALGGLAGDDAEEASEAAHLWTSMLADASSGVSHVRVLTRQCLLWRTAGFSGAAGLLGAKLALRTRPESLDAAARPGWLSGVGGDILTLGEMVIDPRSLLEELARPHADALLKGAVTGIRQDSGHVEIEIESARHIIVRAGRLILAAGLGNQRLHGLAHVDDAPMQQRPLRQTLIRGQLPMVFGHCIDGAKTRITVTSDQSGRHVVWQIGGQIAEDGPRLSPAEFRAHAMREIARCLPAVSFDGCEFAAYDAVRAEPRTGDGRRPPKAYARASGRITTLWPVKLVLAPMAARTLIDGGAVPAHSQKMWPADLPRPQLAARPWETAQWSPLP